MLTPVRRQYGGRVGGAGPIRYALLHFFHGPQNLASLGFSLPRHANAPPTNEISALLPRRDILVHGKERYPGLLQKTFRQTNSNRILQAGLDQDVDVAFVRHGAAPSGA